MREMTMKMYKRLRLRWIYGGGGRMERALLPDARIDRKNARSRGIAQGPTHMSMEIALCKTLARRWDTSSELTYVERDTIVNTMIRSEAPNQN